MLTLASASSRPQYGRPSSAVQQQQQRAACWSPLRLPPRRRRRQRPRPPAAATPTPAETATTAAEAKEQEAYARGYAAGLLASSSSSSSSMREKPASQPPPLARSAAKGVSWRIFSAAITVSLAALVFGQSAFDEAGGAAAVGRFAIAEFCVKLATYVAHERLWAWIDRDTSGGDDG